MADVIEKKRNKYVYVNDKKGYLFLKRVIDILGSIVGLILFLPISVLISIAIKIEDPKGKILFCQERVGINNKTFKMYKFRSMVSNAEELLKDISELNEMDGPVFKIKEDPRITKVGKFIRKTSLDEIPQFFNILKGDMTLVGPRPPLVCEVDNYGDYEMQRLTVKPGLTCYWQIGGRNSIDFKKWVELDLKYIEERNIFVDIKIIFKTFFVLFGDENAS
ncbi:MAG: Undecaprenyl-phosphate galactose phosphotransferase [Intestinibacter bartlettii DORA_8_9]|uniref:UDP-N-acetylgalactosamine-undecaprenyl-phosphate N-acetylgalactosaminephosphotransferase n=1 Tax=Intestinibacter bartlettii TaxID=261299 RepID=A0A6N3BWC1_9FIRM|nr:MAG: Undecaprenyl-phosphate galactose phosphotransferase [Intestinibacter bartlettii DORA_8_9]